MARSTLYLLLLSLLYITITVRSAATSSSSLSFIRSSCRATTYPALCFQSLSAYAPSIQGNQRQLAQTALSVSLARAQNTVSFVNKLTKFKGLKGRETAALRDCAEEVSDTVDRLSKSIKELKSMRSTKGQDFQWHISNIETWVSAALTDETTCVDGFAGKEWMLPRV
ncbi:hypothetical protein K2173_027312 [Erythroxylum novogranatense]|uniref:Pectinesterase inhibitor domain-containing protein n=1 Tax=Erythroxylum novogranatense TaxID=1862640 RepID=A0AAV8TYU4_9ROSI|nr:hypothetical protein K2173_027312 [Erythroxylum novogranatense]